ncbi:bacillithiol biosynthesis cysteine-adding enzyme BshC [Bacillus massiliigorillae]|uniref:bacillithiol biosynthesis cysteine-adding enzyme BshC n=1 Tax=Bacillus massiliigorillae TaxID=1243664 RepID=UPI00039FC63C|nr:bacillithiol biosynthesis cysteine-adding enzyme BshC [Bacillus massiliigorillae]
MEIKEIVLPSINKFASDYVKNLEGVDDYFHYDLKEAKVYEQRYHDLMEQSFNRKDLALVIEKYLTQFGISPEVRENIERLKQEDSVVVIGGQQAGLLTGPLYTIHKVISIIKLAKEQENQLQKPVIPVFWIAGEDHDLDEVNHVYVEKEGSFHKKVYRTAVETKAMISDVPIDQESLEQWLQGVFSSFEETVFTKELYRKLQQYCHQFDNFTSFFSCIINELFKNHGLLLIDSGDKSFRKIQSSFFETLIMQNREINAEVRKQQELIKNKGYSITIGMDDRNANLFYYNDQERVLLEYDEEKGCFTGKSHSISFTKDELLEIAKCEPEKLSNNVVTRPMMQENVFPVLAFISGPGEIAYWAELKQAFEHLEMKLPPIVPRMNITILERKINKALQEVDMDIYEALVQGTEKAKQRFLSTIEDDHVSSVYHKMEQQLIQNHTLFSHAALDIDRGLEPLLKKNVDIIQSQLEFIQDKVQQTLESKHQHTIQKFTSINNALRPNGGPQERLINIYYYLNQYGPRFVDELLALPLEANPFHKVIIV